MSRAGGPGVEALRCAPGEHEAARRFVDERVGASLLAEACLEAASATGSAVRLELDAFNVLTVVVEPAGPELAGALRAWADAHAGAVTLRGAARCALALRAFAPREEPLVALRLEAPPRRTDDDNNREDDATQARARALAEALAALQNAGVALPLEVALHLSALARAARALRLDARALRYRRGGARVLYLRVDLALDRDEGNDDARAAVAAALDALQRWLAAAAPEDARVRWAWATSEGLAALLVCDAGAASSLWRRTEDAR